MNSYSKKDLILKTIIETYLNGNIPVGSNELNNKVSIPASTIRVYFKKLSDEGILTQLHISSGRIPTTRAMKAYWRDLIFEENLVIRDLSLLEFLLNKFEIYALVYGGDELILNEINVVNNKFIILDFKYNELVLKFSQDAFLFMQRLVGLALKDIENLAFKVNFEELLEKIIALKQAMIYYRYNESRAYQIYQNDNFIKLLSPKIGFYFDEKLKFEPLFEEGFMGLKFKSMFLGKESNIIFAGSVYSDFKTMLNIIKEAA
ncbi:HrcA family transcriptional regulator [Campylobacter insulaenigrae]|uniref:HrcA family transcriptional regulator n=1 Tax=Campylobacter insulaenigrae TaxID=260714 RepID=A0ABY3G332_9BACT|nr:HrcA family transcriptional regulator [Campylobacter insulaenigrae]MCR6571751.1 HrcA family transcriptional regulator [Campylobacter insulaenigrae]MCR6576455.1 HrcA family transcriptional regulator [Campylobacter insulaenigrae]MCR6577921.1 HrcA family transcriptional regulator [Campylobacter insulaenigrae]MCR6581159.1 HrcA family transcriptional regulator [Campylobacter insulaenigrae]MCR6582825.1 HrcA family transcriptional regulator [Campylobacter insulaenigrae]